MSEVTLANSLREKMLRDEVAYTLSVKLVRSVELPMMAKTAGFDGILIDMEHSSFDLDTTSKYNVLRWHHQVNTDCEQVKSALPPSMLESHLSFVYRQKILSSYHEFWTEALSVSLYPISAQYKTPKTLLWPQSSSRRVTDHQPTTYLISNTVPSQPRSQILS